MGMKIQKFFDAKAFREIAYPFMLEREGQNCLGIDIIDSLINYPEQYPEFYLVVMSMDDKPVAAIWMTPPHPLGFADIPNGFLGEVGDFIKSLPKTPSGIIGLAVTAARFVDMLAAASDIKIRSKMAQRIYELRKVEYRPKVLGGIRPAVESDRGLLESWGMRFAIDCGLKYDHVLVKEYTNTAIKHKTRFLWEIDSEPVAMVGVGGNTPSGIRINWVYTPPEHRGKGCASAIVAEVSQMQLDLGKQLCFLFTDLANPTSNSIYQRIGYRPVGDSAHYSFE